MKGRLSRKVAAKPCKPCKKGEEGERIRYWARVDGRIVRHTEWNCVRCSSTRVIEQEVALSDVPEGQERQQVEYLLRRYAECHSRKKK